MQLSAELKVYVDWTDEEVLAADAVKQGEELEKSVHNVKEKMNLLC